CRVARQQVLAYRLRARCLHRRAPWGTKASLELAMLPWVSWFNHHRLLAPTGYIPPAEAEENYYQRLTEKVAVEVSINPSSLHGTRGGSAAVSRMVEKRRHVLASPEA